MAGGCKNIRYERMAREESPIGDVAGQASVCEDPGHRAMAIRLYPTGKEERLKLDLCYGKLTRTADIENRCRETTGRLLRSPAHQGGEGVRTRPHSGVDTKREEEGVFHDA